MSRSSSGNDHWGGGGLSWGAAPHRRGRAHLKQPPDLHRTDPLPRTHESGFADVVLDAELLNFTMPRHVPLLVALQHKPGLDGGRWNTVSSGAHADAEEPARTS